MNDTTLYVCMHNYPLLHIDPARLKGKLQVETEPQGKKKGPAARV